MALEPDDELGLPWDDWADGRAYVLRRGRDFFRNADLVQDAARNAARRLGKTVTAVKEQRVGKTYVWVQFSDYEIELGSFCPSCGEGDALRLLNRQNACCISCGATVVLLRPKKQKGTREERRPDDDAAGELIASLFASASPSEPATQPVTRQGGGISREEMRDLFARSKEAVPIEEARRWTRRGFNDVGAVIASGPFSSTRAPIETVDAADAVEVCVLLELAAKEVDVRVGVVFADDGGVARYRVILADPARIKRPGRYTFSVLLPGGTLVAGLYDARVSAAFVHGGEFSRVARRQAFSITVSSTGDAVEPPEETLLIDALDWRVEAGDGPWKLADGHAGAQA